MPQAADLAVDASVEWLKQLRDSRSEEEVAQYLGLRVGTTVCFVIDVTGSMTNIRYVSELAQKITDAKLEHDVPRPSDFVLMPFSDPGIL